MVAFNAVGVAGFFLQTGALWLLVHVAHLPYVAAAAVSVEATIVHNFICHWCWTWRDRARGRPGFLTRLLRFNLTNGAVSLAVNVGLMALLQGGLGVHYLLANAAGVACGAAANFVLGDRVVFRPVRPGPRPADESSHLSNTRAISSRSAGSSPVHRPATSI